MGAGREHCFPPVRVLVGDTFVGLPVIDLGNRAGRRGGGLGLHRLPGGSTGGWNTCWSGPPPG
jgi:hypothetical protein